MPYVRSRKFCCCLPVRFGVFCESLLGIGVGGLFGIAAWVEISKLSECSTILNDALIFDVCAVSQ